MNLWRSAYSSSDFEADCSDMRLAKLREPEPVECGDGLCGAEDCPRCHPENLEERR